MMDFKKIVVAFGAGALVGAVAAAKVDIGVFRGWLVTQGLSGVIKNMRLFNWPLAIGRWLDGALAAGVASALAAAGFDQFGG